MAELLNTGFEVDLGSWVENDNVPDAASMTPTRDTGTFHNGVASMKLVDTAAEDDFMQQNVLKQGGNTYQLSAWVNCTSFTTPATNNRGLFMISQPSVTTAGSDLLAVTSGWEYRSCSVKMASTDTSIDVRLYCPLGTVFWDDINLSVSVSSLVSQPRIPAGFRGPFKPGLGIHPTFPPFTTPDPFVVAANAGMGFPGWHPSHRGPFGLGRPHFVQPQGADQGGYVPAPSDIPRNPYRLGFLTRL